VVDSGNRRYSRYRAKPHADATQAIEDQAGRANWNQPPQTEARRGSADRLYA
jgi:hypothetical protein